MTKSVPTNDAKTRRTFTRSAFMARFLVVRWLGKKRRGRQQYSEDTPPPEACANPRVAPTNSQGHRGGTDHSLHDSKCICATIRLKLATLCQRLFLPVIA